MNKSDSITDLAAALSKFQTEVKNPQNSETVKVETTKGSYNYKYAPLDEILTMVRPLLGKNGLSIVQAPSSEGADIVVTTTLLHSTGQYIEFEPLKLKADKATAQGAGSAITYARRYALSAILGISSEDDDDGNAAEPKEKKSGSKSTSPASTKKNDTNSNPGNNPATKNQVEYIVKLAKKKKYEESINGYIKSNYKKDNLDELAFSEASELIELLKSMEG